MSTEITINQDRIDINVDTSVITIESPQGGYPLPNNVYSVFGRVGNVVAEEGDYDLTQLGDVTITGPLTGQSLIYNGTSWVNSTETYTGTVTSVAMTTPTGLTVTGSPITTSGTLALALATGYSIPTTASQATWDSAYNDKINSAAVTGTTTKTLTLNQQDGGTITATWSDYDTAPVTSVFGRTGAITAQSGDYNTLQVTENTNLYFTEQRARYSISGDATSGVVYQNTTGIIALDDIPNTSLLHDSVTINSKTVALGASTTLTTTDIGEGTNLYFTTARAQAAISGTAPISVASGVVSISQSGPSTNGYLSSADWNTFNTKQSALTLGDLTSSDITVTGGTGAVVGSGSTLTLATVNSNVGTYGSSIAIPVITVNAKGLTTAVSTVAVSIPSGSLSFIGDVTGTGSTGSDTTLTLATVNSNIGEFGDSVTVPTFTVNAKGLITAASENAIPTATSSVTGLLTSTDWSTFNAKQAQLNGTGFVKVSGTTVSYDNSTYLTTIEGIAAGGELSGTYASPSLVNSAVTGKVLTGLNVTGGTVTATDSILDAFGKVQNQINGLIGGSQYQGTWNASTNTPALASGVGTKGYYYIVSVAGSTNLDGITDWNLGDWAIYDGTAWQQVDNTDAVVSVNGFTGAVSLTTSNIAEGTNEYFTTARARQSVSAGTGISYDNSTGVITNSAPDQTVSLTASTGISTSGFYPNFTITNTAPDQTVSLTGGTGISATGTYPNFTITNTAPDQTVSLTGAGGTSITGTYPNFTITSSVGTGTVTSVGLTNSGDALSITGSPITSSGTFNIGFLGTGAQYIKGDGTLAAFPTTIDQAKKLVTEVYNATGATLTKGTVVYINGGQGNLPTVTKALASADNTSAQTYGVVQSDITNNNNGFVVVIGSLNDIDTSAYASGTQLYLSGTTAGEWTSTKPYAPIHLVYVGIVVRSHPTQGVVEIRIQNGYELEELHDVSAQSPSNGDILQYVSSTSLWTKTAGTTSAIAEGSNLYYTDARARGAISLTTTGNNGASTYNSTTGVLNVPTYTLAGLGGINLTSLSATSPLLYDNTTGVFSIQQASGSQAGYLSSADWTTFNSKQSALTNPVTGTGTTNYLPKFTGASTITNSIIYDNGTLIGIGTSTPSYKLDVQNNVTDFVARILNLNTTTDSAGLLVQCGVNAGNEIALFRNAAGTSRVGIYANGNVGIGATNPNYRLVVNSAIDGISAGISGTTYGIRFDNGGTFSSGMSTIHGVDSTLTGSYQPIMINGSDVRFGISATEKMRLNSSGNLGIGTNSPAFRLHVVGPTNGVAYVSGSSNAYRAELALEANGQFTGSFVANPSASSSYGGIGTSLVGITTSSTDFVIATSNTERLRVNTSGHVLIGQTSASGSTNGIYMRPGVESGFIVTNDIALQLSRLSSTGDIQSFYSGNTRVGTISVSGSNTSYNTSSDYRLKDDFKDFNGIDLISKIRTYDFKWKLDDTRNYGVIAHEIEEIIPYVVMGEKDGEFYQGVDYSKLVPVLIKAIQELSAKVSALENKS
jgi:hypothetical protein